jgi:hypothetical protein
MYCLLPERNSRQRILPTIFQQKTLDCYVDADFAGNRSPLTTADPSSVKSHTGYVILFANCPLFWASKLQIEVALSTTEMEYIALLQAMRDPQLLDHQQQTPPILRITGAVWIL